MQKTLSTFVLLILTAPALADITIDPDSMGATDVIQDPDGIATPLTNPIPDPLDMGTTGLAIGKTSLGTLAITNGGQITSGLADIGMDSGSVGMAIVDGAGSLWTVDTDSSYSDTLHVGGHGVGTLSITTGGQVSVSGRTDVGDESDSTGSVLVDGTGSMWTCEGDLYVGNYGTGALNTLNAGNVTSKDYVYIGYQTDSHGAVSVNGPGSIWTIEGYSLYLGRNGTAAMNITNGGRVDSRNTDIGYSSESNGIVVVDGVGSTWMNDGSLEIGGTNGSGTLNIQSGGYVSSQTTEIGDGTNSVGTATVSGLDSTWLIDGTLYIGRSGAGTLDVLAGGQVSSNTATIGYDADSEGVVTVDGVDSKWTVDGDLHVGQSGMGTIEIRNEGSVDATGNVWISQEQIGSQVVFDNAILHAGGLLATTSSLIGTGTIQVGGLVSNVDLTFDQSNGLQQQFLFNSEPGQNITVHLDQSLSGALGAGYSGASSLHIADGQQVVSSIGILGWHPGSNGSALVEGMDSLWTIQGDLDVGRSGTGMLTIRSSGVVNAAGTVSVDPEFTGSRIVLDNSTLHAGSLQAAVSDLNGTGTIYASGLVSDVDLVFDNSNRQQHQFDLNGLPGQDITIHLMQSSSKSLGAGYKGVGSLSISDTHQVESSAGILGWHPQSVGTATVTGIGSAWSVNGTFHIGKNGEGSLSIVDNARMISRTTFIGHGSSAIGTATISGLVSEWDISGDLNIGYGGDGTLHLTNGAHVSSESANIGFLPDSTGVAIVEGAGTEWTINSSYSGGAGFTIGDGGVGTLSILYGGSVLSNNTSIGGGYYGDTGTGVVNVDGMGSAWTIAETRYVSYSSLSIGNTGHGTLNITHGGRVASGNAAIGGSYYYGDTGTGVVNVDGAGSTWTITGTQYASDSSFSIGNTGHGTLNITHGGRVASGNAAIGGSYYYGDTGTGVVNVDGAGSTWTITGTQYASDSSFSIGNTGHGTLNITHGGRVASGNAAIGGGYYYGSTATGVVNVDGAGSVWTIDDSYYPYDSSFTIGSSGTLNITDGGTVVSGQASIGYSRYGNPGTGNVTVDGTGSVWLVGFNSYNRFQIGLGSLDISLGGTVISGSTTILPGGSVTLTGNGSAWTVKGGLDIGEPYYSESGESTLAILNGGLVVVESDVSIVAGWDGNSTLAHGIGSDGPGLLEIDGSLTIGGSSGLSTLSVTLDGGINPVNGEEFIIVTANTGISGMFDNEFVPALAGDYFLDWAVHYNENDITLEVLSSVLAGDFNSDGDVDHDDLSAWQTGFGMQTGARHAQGDANADGDVDGVDFLIWQTQRGMTSSNSSSDLTIVPEPSSIMMVISFISFAVFLLPWKRSYQFHNCDTAMMIG